MPRWCQPRSLVPQRFTVGPVRRVLWLLGPSGVGKSTVGWLAHRRVAGSAFVDADQLGLCFPAPVDDPANHRLKACTLADLAFPEDLLVVAGRVEDEATLRRYLDALPDRTATSCRLRAGSAELRARLAERGGPMAGLADASVAEAARLERDGVGDVAVDTGGRTADEVAARVVALAAGRARPVR
jgi:chloramphenicol 3-O-phosphotransferase